MRKLMLLALAMSLGVAQAEPLPEGRYLVIVAVEDTAVCHDEDGRDYFRTVPFQVHEGPLTAEDAEARMRVIALEGLRTGSVWFPAQRIRKVAAIPYFRPWPTPTPNPNPCGIAPARAR